MYMRTVGMPTCLDVLCFVLTAPVTCANQTKVGHPLTTTTTVCMYYYHYRTLVTPSQDGFSFTQTTPSAHAHSSTQAFLTTAPLCINQSQFPILRVR